MKPLVWLYDFLTDLMRLMVYPIFDRLILLLHKPPDQPAPAILLVRLDAIGDYLMFRPLLEELRKSPKYCGRQVVLCCNPVWRELVEKFDVKTVDRFIWLDRHRFARSTCYRYRKIKELRITTYETAINPVFTRHLWFDDRIMSIVAAIEKIGSSGDPGTVTGWRKKIGDRAYSRLLPASPDIMLDLYRNQEFFEQLLGYSPEPILPPAMPVLSATACRHCPSTPYAILFAGASAAYKKWPLRYFLEVGDYLARTHQLEVLLTGGNEEANDLGKAVPAWPDGVRNLSGKTTLTEMVALVQNAEILISNETMAPHIAALSGAPPCIVVSCSPCQGRFFPYPDEFTSYHIIYHPEIAKDLETFQRISNQPGYYNTFDIAAITPKMVIDQAAMALLSKKEGTQSD